MSDPLPKGAAEQRSVPQGAPAKPPVLQGPAWAQGKDCAGSGHDVPIKAVLFDLDGTLYDPKPLRARMLSSLLGRVIRGPISGAKILRTLRLFRRMREDLRALGDSAPSLDEVQYAEPARVLGSTPEAVREAVRDWMFTKPLPLVAASGWADLRGTLTELKAAGLRLGVFSDYPPEGKLRALGVYDLFDVSLAATDPEVNAFKPHPAGFLEGARQLDAGPSEVLYVGDRFDVDGAGARAAGMPCLILMTRGRDGHGAEADQASPAERAAGPPQGIAASFGDIPGALGLG